MGPENYMSNCRGNAEILFSSTERIGTVGNSELEEKGLIGYLEESLEDTLERTIHD